MSLDLEDNISYSGEFIDATYAELEWWDSSDRSGTSECWAGDDENGRRS
jgi:hypothetical protein